MNRLAAAMIAALVVVHSKAQDPVDIVGSWSSG